MSQTNPPFDANDIETCIKVLETLVEDRVGLSLLSQAERKALLIAAGRVSRPDKLERMKLAKTQRRLQKRREIKHDNEVRNQTAIRRAREEAVYQAPLRLPSPQSPPRKLHHPRACYVCKTHYNELHFFYDSMCIPCGDFNYAKRFQTADLTGRIALITGARVKIGYHVSLMCLRAGAQVIATTRFPHDSVQRYAKEKDFHQWKDRLHIYGLDLRHAPSVEIFAGYVDKHYSHLDLLINNAAQTVRRPPGFYRHLMEGETESTVHWDEGLRALLRPFEQCKGRLANQLGAGESNLPVTSGKAFQRAAVGIQESAALSQIPYSYDDETNAGLDVFPSGELDADEQQVDRRAMNSWRLTLSEVPTPEMLEVHLVNAVAPFVLCSKLKGALKRSPHPVRHVVNVSAMEGKFTRYTKTDKHPHTNMAKAALNMMTVTSAPDYLKDQIYMNAVDTGWVTDEDPETFASRKRDELNFQPPLDIVDGAARICDPFFHGFRTGDHVWGRFLKDYRPTEW